MSARKRRVYEAKFKLPAVERLISGEPIEALAAELGVTKLKLYQWQLKFRREGVLRRAGRPSRSAVAGEIATAAPLAVLDDKSARQRIAELERKTGGWPLCRRSHRRVDRTPFIMRAFMTVASREPGRAAGSVPLFRRLTSACRYPPAVSPASFRQTA